MATLSVSDKELADERIIKERVTTKQAAIAKKVEEQAAKEQKALMKKFYRLNEEDKIIIFLTVEVALKRTGGLAYEKHRKIV